MEGWGRERGVWCTKMRSIAERVHDVHTIPPTGAKENLPLDVGDVDEVRLEGSEAGGGGELGESHCLRVQGTDQSMLVCATVAGLAYDVV